MKIGIISDEGDAHGLSIAHTASYRAYSTRTALIGTFPVKARYMAYSASIAKLDTIVVADLPINRHDPDSTLSAYKTLVNTGAEVVHLDHHPMNPEELQKLEEIGVKVVNVTGLQMTYILLQMYSGKRIDEIEVPSIEELTDRILANDNVYLLYKAFDVSEEYICDAILLVAGNYADFDAGLAPLFRKYGNSRVATEIKVLGLMLDLYYRMHGLSTFSKDPCKTIVELDRLYLDVSTGKIEYPPQKYSRQLIENAERKGAVLVVNRKDSGIPESWIPKTVSYAFEQVVPKDVRFIVVYGSGTDSRTGKYNTYAMVFERWYDTINLIPVLREVAEKHGFNQYGHPTFSVVAKEGEHTEELQEVLEELIEKLNRFSQTQ